MSISGCQVEPINPLYDWEKEPLAIIKDGCQADHVGLVCPPQRSKFLPFISLGASFYTFVSQAVSGTVKHSYHALC